MSYPLNCCEVTTKKINGVIYKIGDKIKRACGHRYAGENHTIQGFGNTLVFNVFVKVKETNEWMSLKYYDAPIRPKSLKQMINEAAD